MAKRHREDEEGKERVRRKEVEIFFSS